ncbi:MAG: hypothetical protein O3A94_09185 [Proteobacteria bacterium]|nr:hypothetical protein [Pseudomonadota bacterium]
MIPISILRIAVIVMGVLIVAGLVVIGVKILQKSKEAAVSLSGGAAKVSADAPAPSPALSPALRATQFRVSIEQLGLGSNARLLSMDVEGGRLVLHVQSGGAGGRVLIVDLNSGAVLGEIALPPPLQ